MSDVSSRRIVVGIDGSEQAASAAVWAIDEAIDRRAVLHLVYVIRTDVSGTPTAGEYESAVRTAKRVLASTRDRIRGHNAAVSVTTQIAQGSPAGVLMAESRSAAMVCVGWSGTSRLGMALLGSTATSLAERSACPVAIVRAVRTGAGRVAQSRWIIVPVSSRTHDGDIVADDAVDEARRRGWPMLTVWTDAGTDKTFVESFNELASRWRQRYPDVHIYPVATERGLARFLQSSPDLGGLVIVDGDSCTDVPGTIRTVEHAGSTELTVLVTHSAAVGAQPASA